MERQNSRKTKCLVCLGPLVVPETAFGSVVAVIDYNEHGLTSLEWLVNQKRPKSTRRAVLKSSHKEAAVTVLILDNRGPRSTPRSGPGALAFFKATVSSIDPLELKVCDVWKIRQEIEDGHHI